MSNIPVWDIKKWKQLNINGGFPKKNKLGHNIIIGCNYHTTWQTHRNMRFILTGVDGLKARLQTRNTKKDFYTDIDSLVFIESNYNIEKAKELTSNLDLF